MTRHLISSTVSNASVIDLIETSLSLGYVNQSTLLELDLVLCNIANLTGRTPEKAVIALWEKIDSLNPHSGAGLAIGSVINSSAKGLLASWVSQSDTLREALDIFMDNISLMSPSEHWQLQLNGEEATLFFELNKTKGYPDITVQRSMSALVTWARALTGITFPIKLACFSCPKPPYTDAFHTIFGTELRFGSSCNCLVFDSAFLDQKVISSNVFLKEQLKSQARQLFNTMELLGSMKERVAYVIDDRLDKGLSISADQVACELGMSRQSLHRKLSSENISFKAVFDVSRAKLASQLLLVDKLSIEQTSLALGFKDSSSFYKAFQRWFGVAPSRYRLEQ